MDNYYLNKLEFNKITEILANYAVTKAGQNLCLELTPTSNSLEVTHNLKATTEAKSLIEKNGSAPFYDIDEADMFIKTIKSQKATTLKGLLTLATILRNARELKQYFISSEDYQILEDYFSMLYINKDIENKIFINIIDENTIADSASPKLNSIRKQYKNLEQEIKKKLNNIIHSNTYSKYIQDPIVTIRNDRFVIPVKQEYQSNIKGFAHDYSASGSTIFIEPLEVFDLNNTINNLKIDEEIEINRILEEYSSMFYPIFKELKADIDTIALLDFIFAKAKYALELKATEPIINDKKEINLIKAKHPLIDKDKVIPIDINIGQEFSCLVITGPNTGGKTVTLKTVGLLTLMAMSGMHIPASDNSSIYIFDNVFADIGDEQSIQESLSTFSSHIKNIVKIIENSTANSLILLDELGSGTDPLEGSSLAISILEHFYNKDNLILATTHYPQVKNYALTNKGFKNASCEFDLKTLKPTYKLLIGIPGKSMAFAISEKLGISKEILNRANDFMDEDAISIEDLLKSIHDEKEIIDNKQIEIDKNLIQITDLRKSLEKDNREQELKNKMKIEQAKIEARDILLEAKDNATEIIREMKNNSSDLTSLENLRNKLNKSIKDINFIEDIKETTDTKPEDIHIDDEVYIISLNQNGIVLSNVDRKNKVQVEIGNMKTYIDLNDIKPLGKNTTKEINKKINYASTMKSKNIPTEINIIGLTVDEAIPLVDKYIDDAMLSNLVNIRIVHGKGSGKLRQGIQTYLKSDKRIKSFRLGIFGEGDQGVTVAELNK